jgi:hypothetical protein
MQLSVSVTRFQSGGARTDSLAVKSSGMLESFLDVSTCGSSVPLFTLGPSTSSTSSSSVGVSSSGGRSGD